jgi:hypothetical protein
MSYCSTLVEWNTYHGQWRIVHVNAIIALRGTQAHPSRSRGKGSGVTIFTYTASASLACHAEDATPTERWSPRFSARMLGDPQSCLRPSHCHLRNDDEGFTNHVHGHALASRTGDRRRSTCTAVVNQASLAGNEHDPRAPMRAVPKGGRLKLYVDLSYRRD